MAAIIPTLAPGSLSRFVLFALMAAALLVQANAAVAAGTPEQACQATKNKTAGKYTACRQNAAAKLATTADLIKYNDTLTKCGTKLTSAWQKAIDKAAAAGATCLDAPLTEGDFQTILAASSDNIADALAGLGLTDCNADLATCAGDLGTCTDDLGTCTTDLAQATSDLGTCNGTVTTLSGNLSICNGSLTTCNGNLGTCTTDLATANGGLSTCNADLTTCNGTVGTLTGNLATCNSGLTTCNGSLGTCSASLGTCTTDLATCLAATPQGQLLKTGQTICYNAVGTVIACAGTGQDGELQNGLARAYTDNGDGTITDTKTGLMWEKLSDDGSLHDKDNFYVWADAFAVKMAGLNGGGGFAGHTDWRLPNINELLSLVNYGTAAPSVNAAFNTACAPSCTVTTCSCTRSSAYYSATTHHLFLNGAWFVDFSVSSGLVSQSPKNNFLYIRAVRGGA